MCVLLQAKPADASSAAETKDKVQPADKHTDATADDGSSIVHVTLQAKAADASPTSEKREAQQPEGQDKDAAAADAAGDQAKDPEAGPAKAEEDGAANDEKQKGRNVRRRTDDAAGMSHRHAIAHWGCHVLFPCRSSSPRIYVVALPTDRARAQVTMLKLCALTGWSAFGADTEEPQESSQPAKKKAQKVSMSCLDEEEDGEG